VAKLTKADAACQLGIARSTLYKLIDQGKVSPSPEGLIDQAELVRVAAYVDTFKGFNPFQGNYCFETADVGHGLGSESLFQSLPGQLLL
jgi:DNA-binding XRE family transcriptional regulator